MFLWPKLTIVEFKMIINYSVYKHKPDNSVKMCVERVKVNSFGRGFFLSCWIEFQAAAIPFLTIEKKSAHELVIYSKDHVNVMH